MTERIALKEEKEAFVANLPGGPISEINAVTVVALSAYALWAALQTRTRATDVRRYGVAAYILDVALNSFGLLFSITTYSSHPILLNILLLTPALYFYFQPAYSPTAPQKLAAKENGKKPTKGQTALSVSNHNPFVTAYRGGMMVITCLAILAVDFKVFPRRFAKAETWGTSLMDLGVGSFVFSSGLVSSRQKESTVLRQLSVAFRSSSMILFLGIVRMILIKKVEYQEHVTEYGVHWNFFVTLGMLPPFVTLLRILKWNKVPYSVFAVIIIGGYQWAMYNVGIRGYNTIIEFVVKSERTDLFNQNREGIFSFLGYLSIFLVGMDIGNLILAASPPALLNIKSPRTRTFVWLIICSIVSMAALQLTGIYTKIEVSRRFANLPYVLWTVAYNTTFLLGYLTVQTIFFPNPNTLYIDAVPWTLDAFNRNGLAIFLLANVLTGTINLTINTLKVTNFQAMVVLSIYTLVLNGVAGVLHYKGWRIKI